MITKLLGLFLSIGALTLSAGCHREDANAMVMPERPPAPVSVAAATKADVPVYIDQIGTTSARESVTIVPQVSGKLLSIHFSDGAVVNQGDPLFTIDARPFKAALASAVATSAQNKAKLKFAQDEVKRMSEIKGTGAVSVTEWEQKVNAVAIAEAEVQWAEAEVDKAKLDVEYCEIKSPINGRLGQRLVDPGNVVTGGGPEGGTRMVTIQAFDPIYADFTVTENELGTVRKFMAQGLLPSEDPQGRLKVLVDVPGDAQQIITALGEDVLKPTSQPVAIAATQPGSQTTGGASTTQLSVGPREGLLTFLDNTVQQGTGTVKVRATLPNSDRYFWPGQFVRVRLVLMTKKDAVLIPAQAQQIGQVGPYVYVVKPGKVKNTKGEEHDAMIAEIRVVTPGQRQGGMVVIEKGLEAGEQVVVQGHMGVTPGGAVRDTNAPSVEKSPVEKSVVEKSVVQNTPSH